MLAQCPNFSHCSFSVPLPCQLSNVSFLVNLRVVEKQPENASFALISSGKEVLWTVWWWSLTLFLELVALPQPAQLPTMVVGANTSNTSYRPNPRPPHTNPGTDALNDALEFAIAQRLSSVGPSFAQILSLSFCRLANKEFLVSS